MACLPGSRAVPIGLDLTECRAPVIDRIEPVFWWQGRRRRIVRPDRSLRCRSLRIARRREIIPPLLLLPLDPLDVCPPEATSRAGARGRRGS